MDNLEIYWGVAVTLAYVILAVYMRLQGKQVTLATVREVVGAVPDRLSGLEKENADLRVQVANLERANEHKEIAFTAQIGLVSKQYEESIKTIARLEDRDADREKRLAALETKYQELEGKYQSAISQKDSLVEALAQSDKAKDEAVHVRDTLLAEVETLRGQVARLESELAQAKKDLVVERGLREKAEINRNEMIDQLNRLKVEVANLKAKVEQPAEAVRDAEKPSE